MTIDNANNTDLNDIETSIESTEGIESAVEVNGELGIDDDENLDDVNIPEEDELFPDENNMDDEGEDITEDDESMELNNMLDIPDEDHPQDDEPAQNDEPVVQVNSDLDGDSLESFIRPTQTEEAPPASIEEIMNDLDSAAPVTSSTTSSARRSFDERATEMGLNVLPGRTYHYADRFSEVAYKNVKTYEGSGIVDDTEIPHLVIYTKGIAATDVWKYQNIISDAYQFVGNDVLVGQIKDSIIAVGNPNIQERTFMSPNNTEIRHELIIMNGVDVPEVGSVLPMMQISNTYNGTGASQINFGLTIIEPNNDTSSLSADKFGKIRQIHITGSNTELSAALGSYVTIFNENILSVITENFSKQVTIDEMMELLDKIEAKVGKKRREAIAVTLPTTPEAGATWNLNAWQLFLALTRFTSVEKNISSKKLLESIVEGVLVLPGQMVEALKTINN